MAEGRLERTRTVYDEWDFLSPEERAEALRVSNAIAQEMVDSINAQMAQAIRRVLGDDRDGDGYGAFV